MNNVEKLYIFNAIVAKILPKEQMLLMKMMGMDNQSGISTYLLKISVKAKAPNLVAEADACVNVSIDCNYEWIVDLKCSHQVTKHDSLLSCRVFVHTIKRRLL